MADDDGEVAGEVETFSPALPDATSVLLRVVLDQAARREVSLATAESCTGGMLASLLTDVPGASGVFERGFVVYSNASKQDLLGVAEDDLEEHGAVSRVVAIAMAEGAIEHSRADVAVAITGYADEGPEPGLVHFACAVRDGPTNHRVERFGAIGRGPVRVRSMHVALTMMDQVL